MSRLARLSARCYGRLTPEQKQAVDLLSWLSPGPAERGEAKTVLGWRRSREETIAYAERLLGQGLILSAVAHRLGVGDRYLRRLLNVLPDPDKQPRNRASRAGKGGTNRQRQGVGS
jgi:hypothetical protein